MGNFTRLLDEAEDLISRSRAALADAANAVDTTEKTQRRRKTVSTEITATKAGELYSTGKSVAEVATQMSITYSKARRLIKDSGTPVRDASSRLKGRTRKARS